MSVDYKKLIPLTLLTLSFGYFSSCNSFVPREFETKNQKFLRTLRENNSIKPNRISLSRKLSNSVELKLTRGKNKYIDEQRVCGDAGYIEFRKHLKF